jgi:hypothetical protein
MRGATSNVPLLAKLCWGRETDVEAYQLAAMTAYCVVAIPSIAPSYLSLP